MKYAILALVALAACKPEDITQTAPDVRTRVEACWSDEFNCTAMFDDDWGTGYNYIRCENPGVVQDYIHGILLTPAEVDAQTIAVHDAINQFYTSTHNTWPHKNGWAWAHNSNTFFGRIHESSYKVGGTRILVNQSPNAVVHVSTDWPSSSIHDLHIPSTMIKLLDGQDPEAVLSCN